MSSQGRLAVKALLQMGDSFNREGEAQCPQEERIIVVNMLVQLSYFCLKEIYEILVSGYS